MSLIAIRKMKTHMKAQLTTAWHCRLCLPGIDGMHRERERVLCFCLKKRARFVCLECCDRLSLETIERPGKGGLITTRCICNDTTLRLAIPEELRLQQAIASGAVERTLRTSTVDRRFGVASQAFLFVFVCFWFVCLF